MSNESKTLVNVKKVIFIDEVTENHFEIETSDEIDIEPIKSEGKREILRVKNTIYGINQTEDILIGYKLKLKDNLFNMDTMCLIDGGTKLDTGYQGPVAGKTVDRHPFTIEIITEEKDYSRTCGYAKFTYKHCKGKPAKYKIKDSAFMVPEYEAESIPFKGEKPVAIEFLTNLEDYNVKIKKKDVKISGGKKEKNNKDVKIEVTGNIKWYFTVPINQDDSNNENFVVKKDGKLIEGAVTIDDAKKVVSFIPKELILGTYTAESKAVRKLDGSGKTEPISIEFTTI